MPSLTLSTFDGEGHVDNAHDAVYPVDHVSYINDVSRASFIHVVGLTRYVCAEKAVSS